MHRAILLLTAVVLAGCVGGLGPVPAAPQSGPPSADWTDGEGIDAATLATHHFETLREAGSFTVTRNETVRVDGDARPDEARPDGYDLPVRTRHQVDLDEGRYLGEYETVGYSRSAHFVSPAVTATRRTRCPSGCDDTYDYQQRPEGDTRSERIDRYRSEDAADRLATIIRGVTVGFDYAYNGTVEREGETLHRYRAESTLDTAPPPFSDPPNATATVLVTDDGVVRRVELRYVGTGTVTVDGEEQTVDVTYTIVYTYTAVGETTVERPPWVDRAAEEDSPRSTETADG